MDDKIDTAALNILRAIARSTNGMYDAIQTNDACLVRLMIDHGVVVETRFFIHACRLGHTEIVRLLLDLPLDCSPAAFDNVALLYACENGHTEIVRLLLDLPLERGVNPSTHDNYALRFASQNGHTEIVRILLDLPLERGVNPSTNGNYALRFACYWGHTEIVRMLLDLPPERGVNPNNNLTLRLANSYEFAEIVRMLDAV
jgi:ankyrin repeat protein